MTQTGNNNDENMGQRCQWGNDDGYGHWSMMTVGLFGELSEVGLGWTMYGHDLR